MYLYHMYMYMYKHAQRLQYLRQPTGCINPPSPILPFCQDAAHPPGANKGFQKWMGSSSSSPLEIDDLCLFPSFWKALP